MSPPSTIMLLPIPILFGFILALGTAAVMPHKDMDSHVVNPYGYNDSRCNISGGSRQLLPRPGHGTSCPRLRPPLPPHTHTTRTSPAILLLATILTSPPVSLYTDTSMHILDVGMGRGNNSNFSGGSSSRRGVPGLGYYSTCPQRQPPSSHLHALASPAILMLATTPTSSAVSLHIDTSMHMFHVGNENGNNSSRSGISGGSGSISDGVPSYPRLSPQRPPLTHTMAITVTLLLATGHTSSSLSLHSDAALHLSGVCRYNGNHGSLWHYGHNTSADVPYGRQQWQHSTNGSGTDDVAKDPLHPQCHLQHHHIWFLKWQKISQWPEWQQQWQQMNPIGRRWQPRVGSELITKGRPPSIKSA